VVWNPREDRGKIPQNGMAVTQKKCKFGQKFRERKEVKQLAYFSKY
jgi:hypothetical protein